VAVTILFCLLVFVSPAHNVHIWFITYPANVNALLALVSFAVSATSGAQAPRSPSQQPRPAR
jgi:hypothetical protein